MTAVWAYCRNGDRHYGHIDAWGQGFAVIGGTRIDGVVFIDASLIDGGVARDTQAGSAPVTAARTGSSPAVSRKLTPTAPGSEVTQAVSSSTASPTDTSGRSSTSGESHSGEGEPGDGGGAHIPTVVATPLCRCGCRRDWHQRAAWYCTTCSSCDRYRPTTNAAGSSQPAAS